MIQLIKSSEYLVMPWKNGQGVTSQIDIFPPGESFPGDKFLWRVSSATVQSSAPFSQFPGCDRYLSVLQGDGLILNETVLNPNEIYHFHGEDLIFGKLINKTVLDLGVIFRRDSVRAAMTWKTVPAEKNMKLPLDYEVNYLFCAQGNFALSPHQVQEGDCLKVSNIKNIEITVEGPKDLKFFLIQLSLK